MRKVKLLKRSLPAAALGVTAALALATPALAATIAPYTVSVGGSWSDSWTATAQSGAAAAVSVPPNTAFTPTGYLTVAVPPLPTGYSYDGSWALSNPGLLSNVWCGVGAPNNGQPTFTIPPTGGTITEPLSAIWGTMPPQTSTPGACVIRVAPPITLNAQGYESSQREPAFEVSLPVSVAQPVSPSPTPSPSPSPTPKPVTPQPTPSAKPTPSPTPKPSPSPTKTPLVLPILSIVGVPTHIASNTSVGFVVKLVTKFGQPVPNTPIIVEVEGPGHLEAASSTTNQQGEMRDVLTAGPVGGTVHVFAVGGEVHATTQTTVTGPKTSPSSVTRTAQKTPPARHSHGARAQSPSPFPWWLILVLIGAVALVVLIIIRRRRGERS